MIIYNLNIDLNDEFFQINEVKKQLYFNNVTKVETISRIGENMNIGNALIVLNNLLNICINIKCKYIVVPKGALQNIIKKPIFNKEFNITILPNNYENKTKIDTIIFFFNQ